MVILNIWELRDANGYTILSGGSQAGETWQDSTYYNYCLPISDSCDVYELVFYDSYSYMGWNNNSAATALITSTSGDTLLYYEGDDSYFIGSFSLFSQNYQVVTQDPIASNYDAMAVCDDGSCCYSNSSALQIFASNGSHYMGWQLRDAYGVTILSGGSQAGEMCKILRICIIIFQ